ncbi:16S rRNA (adenine(1518)-N(6)/adenine(1519)-N(6))-dimethyltransferase RsmA [Prochlorococcus marinus]|uniref:16S rRNA (adenine(1518)-N(6)/adenine(1519)-N(6))- dimethyltransferase RsmA n=1 Tax=Prochlorococcus marinus TaxID=1219 RepID=UPI0022B5A553|nr:16S rRNA (adenine(1518)-N(6)/adenine(1519)-N(6))-dimethyltransferase RsmA [Prochlorococcus marinus]
MGDNTLNYFRHIPRKRFGQHWLKDQVVLDQIVKAAELNSEDCVLEVGPGKGALTEKLIESQARFIQAIELDRDLVVGLKKRFSRQIKFSLKEGDVLSAPLEAENGLTINKVVANIPYNITGPLLKRLIGELRKGPEYSFETLVLLMQKEVAQRLVALPGTSNFSALSVRIQLLAKCNLVCDVPSKCFQPAPKVDSKVVKISPFVPSEPDFYKIGNLLEQLLKHAFAGRRKKLRNTIGSFVTSNDQINEFLAYRGISLDQRPQEISPSNWFALAKALKETCVIENGPFQSK